MSFGSDERCNGMDTHSGPLLPDVETGYVLFEKQNAEGTAV